MSHNPGGWSDFEEPESLDEKLGILESKLDDVELRLMNMNDRFGQLMFVVGAWSVFGIFAVAKFVFGKPFFWESW